MRQTRERVAFPADADLKKQLFTQGLNEASVFEIIRKAPSAQSSHQAHKQKQIGTFRCVPICFLFSSQ